MTFETPSSYDKVKLQTLGIYLIPNRLTKTSVYKRLARSGEPKSCDSEEQDKTGSLSIYSITVNMFGKGSRVLLLQELIKDWPCTVTGGRYRFSVRGITENSLNVKPGFIFVARKGNKEDGTLFIEDAIRSGAVAIVIDKLISLEVPESIPVITVPDCRHFLSHASAVLSGNPSNDLTVIAVTGTNGKTTVSHFIGQLLKGLGVRVAVIGTTGIYIDGNRINYPVPQMTTLPAEYLHPLLKDCLDWGVTHVVLEASSMGLATHRLEHCRIDVGVLLNIGVDHFDEHGGKEAYIEAKKKLLKVAEHVIVNQDDQTCVEMANSVIRPYIYFGINKQADVRLTMQGNRMFIANANEIEDLTLSVLGEFNRLNAVAAISVLNALSYKLETILPHVSLLKLPEGRMQRVEQGGVTVVIDYAHTPDALEAVLRSLSLTCKGRLITVFGCGGERDKGKRGEMGELAVLYSSKVLVTSDNPRNEDPLVIIHDILEGFTEKSTAIYIEPDRDLAIRRAVDEARRGDFILIAGKGHEKTQHTAEGVIPFSDEKVATQALVAKMNDENREIEPKHSRE